MSTVPRLAIAALLAPLIPAQIEPADPTPEETAVLWQLNAFRRDPQAFARRILDGLRPGNADHVDWQMFAAEIARLEPAPPLFFDPRLIAASRAHARYMIEAREYGHHETDGKPGFTGQWPHDRARTAGYTGSVAECSIARGEAAFATIAGYIVDAGPPGQGTGGMQEGRGHRVCMIDPKWREIGVGLFAWGNGSWSNVILHGEGEGRDLGRVLGGVALEDHDGDGDYDIGEGIGRIHISIGDLSTMSSRSGAWRLDLPRGAKASKLVARLGSLELVREIPPGRANLQLDLAFDVRGAIADLEGELGRLPADTEGPRRTLRLMLLELRAPRDEAERALAAEVAELEGMVLAGLGTWPRAEADRVLQAARRSFAGTVVEQFVRAAGRADTLARAAAAARQAKGAATIGKQARAAAAIEQELPRITHPGLWLALARLCRELRRP